MWYGHRELGLESLSGMPLSFDPNLIDLSKPASANTADNFHGNSLKERRPSLTCQTLPVLGKCASQLSSLNSSPRIVRIAFANIGHHLIWSFPSLIAVRAQEPRESS